MVPHKGEKCLTNEVGKYRFHVCSDAGLFQQFGRCRKTAPSFPYNVNCHGSKECIGEDVHGPHGWCNIDIWQEDINENNTVKPWGFCSQTCDLPELTPSIYHEHAFVDILPSQRCKQMLSGLFKFPSDDFSPGHELCAGHQLYENNIHHLKDKNQQESEFQEQEEDPEVLIYDDHDQHHKRASVQTVIMRKTKSGQIFYINVEKFNNTWHSARLLSKKDEEDGKRLEKISTEEGIVGGVDACQGDSGGPLWVDWDNRATQVGIISRGILCGTVHRPGVYTRIIPFLDWIYTITSRFGCYTM